MNNFSSVSRRKFLLTAGATAASSIFLKGCFGNPPSSAKTQPLQAQPLNLSPEEKPETTKANLGYIAIVEAAPLIIAKHLGFFAKYGMTDVNVAKQANWGSARDNVEIGSAGGGVDGGQWQMPMPYQISQGLITKGNVKIPMYILAQLNTHGNGIAIANIHKGKGLGLKLDGKKSFFEGLKSNGKKFKAAYTFPKANQEFWLRYWAAASGINPDEEMELLTVPAAQTVANMKTGTMDAFSTGDPWPYRIIKDRVGFISALTAEMWKGHPEEYFAMRGDWVEKNPKATKALLKGLMEAQQWCDNFDNRPALAEILAGRNYFNLPEAAFLLNPFMGKYDLGERQIDDKSMAALYWKDEKGSVSYPYKSHDLWFLTESVRWGFLPLDTLSKAKETIDEVNREDIWREAAKEAGIPASDIPSSTSRGVEEFFDGIKFDPEKPEEYLKSLKIKKVKI
ncbi:MAG TPA: bicarbonate-binding protein [Cyanobacteria bacterium UBA11149]|nr:bicarbonate-binding protein [Cyanobacteria bacterium UBA11367]HBE57170.1 bicarbonate-binding protein [Cyanobacteria bacterium UBA11366]HBK66178.1 bicarbonate-binding protein [Cyanobacteria bacterium UBA11166]HBR73672.1 bicarbonate-binding protein [Cyanobacteria bacterium UBA11159]HBS71457.1 bicarbonate-binding protein [Cyanobacteria bacterium UBA11153]HBW89159.1 bicarbonate-binding protein [Cyanobacteria bacterium UBA11149]HCA94712.1 bicarbonate-binding protein [Cyanobacteria bacterium UBA